MDHLQSAKDVGRLLGALMFEYCLRLYLAHSAMDKERSALLFMSRGGLRMKYLYDRFLTVNKLTQPSLLHDFWMSRFAALKLAFVSDPGRVIDVLAKEFHAFTCFEAAEALLPAKLYPQKSSLLASIHPNLANSYGNRENLLKIFYHSAEYSDALQEHFTTQHHLIMEYLNKNFASYRNLYTVDTGWSGSIIGSLQESAEKWQWYGLFFGRWDYDNVCPWYFNNITGLFTETSGYRFKGKNNAILEYYHLIEGALEPPIPSVEYFEGETCNACCKNRESAVAGKEDEDIWSGVKEYFSDQHSLKTEDVLSESSAALKRLTRVINFPHPNEVRYMLVNDRSADFGRELNVPVICRKKTTSELEFWRQMKYSLWSPGSIAVSGKKFILLRQLMWQILRKIGKIRG